MSNFKLVKLSNDANCQINIDNILYILTEIDGKESTIYFISGGTLTVPLCAYTLLLDYFY